MVGGMEVLIPGDVASSERLVLTVFHLDPRNFPRFAAFYLMVGWVGLRLRPAAEPAGRSGIIVGQTGSFREEVAMHRKMLRATLVAIVCCLLVPSLVYAQRGGRGGPGGPFGGGGILGLLQQSEIQQEIELSEGQEEQLRTMNEAVRDEIRGEMQDIFRNMQDLSDEERQSRFEEIRARMEEIQKDVEGRVKNVLMPHQFERVKQIDLQARIQRGGAAALTEGELADTLGLTESQRDELRERSEQMQQDLQEKIVQLRKEAQNQLLDVLTAEQRAKLQSMMGEDFAVPEAGRGGRGGRQFGFGGRAGRGGGRNRGGGAQ